MTDEAAEEAAAAASAVVAAWTETAATRRATTAEYCILDVLEVCFKTKSYKSVDEKKVEVNESREEIRSKWTVQRDRKSVV